MFQRSLEEEKSFIEDLFKNSGTIFCVLDAKGKMVRHNQAFVRLYGNFSIEDYGMNFHSKIFSRDTAEAIKKWALKDSELKKTYMFKQAVVSKNYIQKWIAWTLVVDRENVNAYFVMTGHEITEQELLYNELENANQRLLLRNEQIKDLTNKQKQLFSILYKIRNAKDSKVLFAMLCQELRRVVSFRNVFLFSANEMDGSFDVYDALDDFRYDQKNLYFEEFKGVLGRVLLDRQFYYSGYVKEDRDYIQHHPEVNSLVYIPVEFENQLICILGVDSEATNAFTEVEIEMLKLCAENLGQFLQDLSAKNQLRQHSYQLKDLHDIVSKMMQSGERQATASILIAEELVPHLAVYALLEKELVLLGESTPNAIDFYGHPHAKALIEMSHTTRRHQQVRVRSQQLFHTCFPIVHEDTSYGALYTMHSEVLSEQDEELLAIVSNQLAILWRLEDLMDSIKEEALIDPLTGLHNRRFIMRRIQEEQHRLERYQGQSTVIMLDLTDFKMVNDEYGHLVGDEVLRELAEILKMCIRETDEIGRFGGDEFVLLLPNTNRTAAEELVRRMEDAFKNSPVTDKKIIVSGDFGIVTIPEQAKDILTALRLADSAMYTQKRRTKDKN